MIFPWFSLRPDGFLYVRGRHLQPERGLRTPYWAHAGALVRGHERFFVLQTSGIGSQPQNTVFTEISRDFAGDFVVIFMGFHGILT